MMSLQFSNKCLLSMLAVLSLSTAIVSQATNLPNEQADPECSNSVPRDCTEIKDCIRIHQPSTIHRSGIYLIQPITYPEPFYVYCDMETDGGGWTVFQKRQDDSVYFYRNWADYKRGFGNINSNYWLGNDKLFYLTAQGDYKLRIDMSDFEGQSRYAVYDDFRIGDESRLYKLYIGDYSGNAGDSMTERHKNMYFTTKDRDNDIVGSLNCAIKYKGGWWYGGCHFANLNGLYLGGPHASDADWATGINWWQWRGHGYSHKATQMKVRRQS